MRFQAVTGKARASSVAPFIYTAFYVVLSALTVLTQLVAFQQNKWDSAATRNSDMYRYGYKLVNLITCAYYVVFGLYVDYLFINLGGQNPLGRERFRRLRMFYNHWIYLSYEAILFCVVLITVIWNAFDPNIVATSYVEQCLLSFMMLNGISLVQAVSSINSSTAETTNDDSAMPVSVAGPPTKMMAAIPSPTGIAPSAYAYSQQNPQQLQQQQYPAQSAMPMSPASSSGSTAAGYGPASGYGAAAAAAYPPQNNNGGYGAYSAPPQAGGMQAGRGGGGGGGYGGANYF
ncbi:hypothetical protein HK405_007851 [Cladochytrium tenue]|nr:hypothetical protein HK405_007851 [Cladochytrium tenue]